MATWKLPRATTTQRTGITPAQSEILFDTDLDAAFIGDGSTSGGIQLATGTASGDVTAAANLGDNLLIRGDGAVKGVQNSGITVDDSDNISGVGTLGMAGDLTNYEAVNDGNPEFRLGSADAEELHIQSVYDTGAQTLDFVLFQTDAASATANKGLFRFNVDGTNIMDVDDGGIDLDTGGALSINGTDVLDATTLGSGVTASSLTSLGTITTGTWQGTTIAVNQGGTNQITYTNGQLLIGNTTGNTLAKATLTEGEGIDITNGTGTITIAGEDATSSNKGIATFDATDFLVTAGDVTLVVERIEDIAGPLVATGGTKTGITVTYQDATGDMDFVTDVTLTGSETLTNKTLTAPAITSPVFTVALDVPDNIFRVQDSVDPTKEIQFEVSGLSTATIRTLTVPDASFAIVGADTTQTLTNKTINSSNNTITNIATADLASPTGTDTNIVTGTAGTSGDLVTWDANGDAIDGPTPPSGTIVGTTDTQTLTNKTLTDADINGGTVDPAIGSGSTNAPAVLKANLNTTQVDNVGSTATDLMSYTIAGGDMGTGQGVKIKAWGRATNSAGAKTIRVDFGATEILGNGSMIANTLQEWYCEVLVFSTGTNTQDFFVSFERNAAGGTDVTSREMGATTETASSDIVIQFTGQATASSRLNQQGMIVEWIN